MVVHCQRVPLVTFKNHPSLDDRKVLSELLRLGGDPGSSGSPGFPGSGRTWRREELAAIFRHQLAAPVRVDLGSLETGEARKLTELASEEGLLLHSFADLFQHAHPPLELLELTKRFAKAQYSHPDSALPHDVARALYFLCIAVAWLRHHQRISELDDESLRSGWQWCFDQPWVDERARRIFAQAIAELFPSSAAQPPASPPSTDTRRHE